jgi:hypothetical protein
MKRPGLILCLTLSNLVLLAVVAWQANRLGKQNDRFLPGETSEPAPRMSAPAAPLAPSAGSFGVGQGFEASLRSPGPLATAPIAPVAGTPGPDGEAAPVRTNWPKFDWRQIESEDYRTYVNNLRTIGCPEETVRDIVSADLLQAYAERRAAVVAAAMEGFNPLAPDDSELERQIRFQRERRALDREMGQSLSELLGQPGGVPDSSREWTAALLDQQLVFLPPDKRAAVRSALLDNADVNTQMSALANDHRTTIDPEALRNIIDRFDTLQDDLSGRLTAGEYEQLQLTTTFTAAAVRRRLAEFRPTEEEFRFIFHQWLEQDIHLARIHALGEPDPGNLHHAVHARVKEKLGEARYQEYLKSWKP